MKRLLPVALVLAAACGPRNKIGDRALGVDSATNGRALVTNQQPATP